MRYLYAIVSDTRPLPALRGLNDAALELLVVDALAAVVSELALAPPSDEATLWAHEHAVESIMADRPLLPVRFGTLLRDDAAVRVALQAGAARFQADLTRLAGCVELSLRMLWVGEESAAPQPDPAAGPGRAYLAARLAATQQQRERQAQAQALQQRFAAFARESRVVSGEGRIVLSATYLLRPDQVADFRTALAETDRTVDSLRLICTGPWPPYSFVSSP